MVWDDEEDTTTYLVIINHEEQYSIWPDYKEIPKGWRAVDGSGIVCPVIDSKMVHKYIAYFIRSGFLKSPLCTAADAL